MNLKGALGTWPDTILVASKEMTTFAAAAFLTAILIAASEMSVDVMLKPCWASQIEFVPVPQPNSMALQGAMALSRMILPRFLSGLPVSHGRSPTE